MTAFAKSLLSALAALCIMSGAALAQAPAGASGTCKDGSYTTATSKRGACRGHGGVKDWFANQKSSQPSSAQKSAQPSSAATAPNVSPAAGAAPAERTGRARATAAPGGGPGQVWVNSASKVYHCSGDRWYGKTEKGSYMTEAAAKAQGDRPAYNKACS